MMHKPVKYQKGNIIRTGFDHCIMIGVGSLRK
jgi:hypothetical protein